MSRYVARLLVAACLGMPLATRRSNAAENTTPTPEPPKAGQSKSVFLPNRKSPEPEQRGNHYALPGTDWTREPVFWGAACELPESTI